ncbi:MAG: diaminopimelate epimerase [Deltaproteobacteria bacterium]
MRLAFEKVHGLGNDFLLVDARSSGAMPSPDQARALCDRNRGVGADGILTLLRPRDGRARARLHIYNPDGSVAEMCGNGLRCAASRLLEEAPGPLFVETDAGARRCERDPGGRGILTEIGRPSLREPEELEVGGQRLRGSAVSLGNPHFVVFASADETSARFLGPLVEQHPRFSPTRTNLELCEAGPEGLRVVVWERGAGLTLACGTGAAAAAAAACALGVAPFGKVRAVDLPGGRLWATVAPDLASVSLRGPAVTVFQGEIELSGAPV